MYLEIEELKQYNVKALYTYKGTSLEDLNLDKYIMYDKQLHSNKVLSTDETIDFSSGDGIITNKINIPIITRSKDCVSIFLFDKEKRVIGNLHSGWRGTLSSIITSGINKMISMYNSNPKDIILVILPSIRKCCFEVDSDVYNLFKEKYPNNKYYTKKDNKYLISMQDIIKDDAIKLGILESNMIDTNICTLCNKDKFNSHRNKDNELNYALIMMEK